MVVDAAQHTRRAVSHTVSSGSVPDGARHVRRRAKSTSASVVWMESHSGCVRARHQGEDACERGESRRCTSNSTRPICRRPSESGRIAGAMAALMMAGAAGRRSRRLAHNSGTVGAARMRVCVCVCVCVCASLGLRPECVGVVSTTGRQDKTALRDDDVIHGMTTLLRHRPSRPLQIRGRGGIEAGGRYHGTCPLGDQRERERERERETVGPPAQSLVVCARTASCAAAQYRGIAMCDEQQAPQQAPQQARPCMAAGTHPARACAWPQRANEKIVPTVAMATGHCCL
jgi:hypothetical protein